MSDNTDDKNVFDGQVLLGSDYDWTAKIATPNLRFIRRNGKLILQQMYEVRSKTQREYKWHDVQLEDE